MWFRAVTTTVTYGVDLSFSEADCTEAPVVIGVMQRTLGALIGR